MKCVVFFTLKMWGCGYMTKLLAISFESLYVVALFQLTMDLITVLVFWISIKPVFLGGVVVRLVHFHLKYFVLSNK
jgi:hypothetical protein